MNDTAKTKQLVELLARCAMAEKAIGLTMRSLVETLPPVEDIQDQPEVMVAVLLGSLDSMLGAAQDYADACREVRDWTAQSMRDMGYEVL